MSTDSVSPVGPEYIAQLADAYEHLYDLVHLRTHPLLDSLAPGPVDAVKQRVRQFHSLLLDAIAEMDPGPEAPAFSNEWRNHRLMVLRYVKGLPTQAVADQLNVSLRQYYRVHEAALAAVASLVWERRAVEGKATEPASAIGSPVKTEDSSGLELLRLEAARVAQVDRYGQINIVLDGVLAVMREMLFQHRVALGNRLPDSLPAVPVGESLLRQTFLSTIACLVENAHDATLSIRAEVTGSVVFLSLGIEPQAAIQPGDPSRLQASLATLNELARLGALQITPLYKGAAVAGFDVQLPRAERTILVIDDNQDVVELMARYLSVDHYRVVTAHDAEDGILKAIEFQPFAITLDLMMPGQDGWDVLQRLVTRPETSRIPVIVCSVLKQQELAFSLGAAGFLEKPLTGPALLSALAELAMA
jgi:CheY-like chemotaxis protein